LNKDMKINNILLDMDGVLADFFSAALHKLNLKFRPKNPVEMSEYRQTGSFDMAKFFGITKDQFWQCVEDTNYFWDNIPAYPWAKQLYEFLSEFAPVTIASNPSHGVSCVYGKVNWLKYNIDKNFNQDNCIFGAKKYLMAKPDTLLIDDFQKNCGEFIAAGGQAVCVPSNWNTEGLDYNKIICKIIKESTLVKA
jgi:5'(3')-deoxyribonucleotidase